MKDAGEKAMALVDGQLAPADVPDLVQELARNAPLVAELQRHLALSRNRIASVYAAKGEEPVPQWLSEQVMRGGGAAGRPAQQDAGFGRRLLQRLQQGYRVPGWSLAAGPALAAAVAALAVLLVPVAAPTTGSVLAESDLGAALDRTVSGKDAALATLRPVLSFRSKSAGWCRQFELRNVNRQVSHALACRSEQGGWSVVASTAPAGGGYAPAGADQRKAIDDRATEMMRESPLSSEEEVATIARRWQPL
jgi:hypothetical protein